MREFYAAASPQARQLAGLLSAVPVITLPIASLLLARMVETHHPEFVAEVFLARLLQQATGAAAEVLPELVEYEFLPGIREALYESLSLPDEYRVLRVVSGFLETYFGLPHDAQVYASSTRLPSLPRDAEGRLYARMAIALWRELGDAFHEEQAGQLARHLAGSVE